MFICNDILISSQRLTSIAHLQVPLKPQTRESTPHSPRFSARFLHKAELMIDVFRDAGLSRVNGRHLKHLKIIVLGLILMENTNNAQRI